MDNIDSDIRWVKLASTVRYTQDTTLLHLLYAQDVARNIKYIFNPIKDSEGNTKYEMTWEVFPKYDQTPIPETEVELFEGEMEFEI